MVEYYSVPDQPLLWVDEKGLNERAKSAMAEIAKADDYGLARLGLHAAQARCVQRGRCESQ